ncbi:hypothetical protein DFQ01_10630 [Paenibacillus cellulosilyticus]|uniref:DUF4352 domain-containing protein n=1 Tax=Paenibacillus cellulosilyticus TaxID=375489 RepID=A0A2V2YV69_9BACL|nr:hypothetical protein [Paenibacillus cellulosilyticus]PWW04749.1 hypothetical protein DFQ01_10630 [Paenibacillus cellulosilyticus]QKS45874.1 hypothetical protein HUB94_16555 [Paenibacillus cellulosilyticus]
MRAMNLVFTLLRRFILAALVIILIVHYISKVTNDWDRGNGDTIASLQADGEVVAISIDKSFPIDNDTFTANAVYVTPKQIMVTYEFHSKQTKGVWTFPAMSLKLITPDGQELLSHSAGSNGTTWGSIGYISFDVPDKPVGSAKLVYDIYGRYGELEIPLVKAGDGT